MARVRRPGQESYNQWYSVTNHDICLSRAVRAVPKVYILEEVHRTVYSPGSALNTHRVDYPGFVQPTAEVHEFLAEG